MKTETITWHELPQDGMPDAEAALLLDVGAAVGEGWWDGENWRWAGSGGQVDAEVIAWALLPEGVTC